MNNKSIKVLILVLIIFSINIVSFADDDTLEMGLAKVETMADFVKAYYYQDIEERILLDGTYSGMFNAMDQHSMYFTADEFEEFKESTGGYFYGVGISIEPDNGYIKVISVIEGSPAENEDILSGDIIKTVNGLDIKGKSMDEVISMIKGEEGTPVTIGFSRENRVGVLEITINRGRVEVNPITFEMKDNGIGYMRISQFSSNLLDFYNSALDELINNGNAKSLIIDLRYNPGGDLRAVLGALERLLPQNKPILHIDYRAYKDVDFYTQTQGETIPIVVLVNEWSASASEIFAGTLKDLKRATIVGVTTYGKGTVQHSFPQLDGTGFKVTVAQYLTGGNNKINGIGVKPDFVIENTSIEYERIKEEFAPMNTYEDSIIGMQDLDTLGAQQRLNYLSYNVREDGYFDKGTEMALAKFQIDNNLLNSGILNKETKDLLENAALEYALEQVEDLQYNKAIEILSIN